MSDPIEVTITGTNMIAKRPTMTVFGHTRVGLEFQADEGNFRFSVAIYGDAEDRAWFASRLRELADEIDAWRPRRG